MKTLQYAFNMDFLRRQGTCIEFFSACQDQNIDAMMELCTIEGQVDFMPLGEGGRGRIREVGRSVWQRLIECFSDLDHTIKDFCINSNGSITCQVQMHGTQTKDFESILNRGQKVNSDQIFIFHFDQ
jgi:hypothetical protein